MQHVIPVNDFSDATLAVVQGLKKRFIEGTDEFRSARVSVLKTEADEPVKPEYEVIVYLSPGMETNNGLMREHGLSVAIYAPDYSTANRLAEVTTGYIKSLIALGHIKYVSIEAAGLHIENQGPEQVRQITASLTVKANKTNLYYIGE